MSSRSSLGLYFTDNFIEISQLSSDGSKLERFNQLNLLQGLVINSEIKNSQSFSQILRQLMVTAKPYQISTNNEVVIGINDNRVFLREFTVPSVPGKNLTDAIEYQVRSLLPVLPPGVETDWQIIGKNTEGQIEVLLVAIPKNIIDSYIAVCTAIGLRVVAVEPAIFAIIRIIEPSQLTGKNLLLVHLGENYGVFSYVTSGNPRFSEFLPQSEIDSKGDIANTVQAYINFANSKHPNRPVEGVLISGSRQDMDTIISDLGAKGIQAVKAVSRLRGTGVINHSLLHTAHGLSLKMLETSPSVNLLPVDFRLGVLKQSHVSIWRAILIALSIFTLAGIGGLGFLYSETLNRRTGLQIQKIQYDQELTLPASKDLINQTDRLNKITGQLVTLRSVVGGEENILRQLSAITPNGVVLSSLLYSRNPGSKKLSDPGSSWVLTGSANSRPLVLDFYRKLTATAEFAGGQLYFGSLEKDIGLTFRIASRTVKK